MNRHRLAARLEALEVRYHPAYPADLLRRLARESGVSEAEIVAKADALVRRFADAGAASPRARLQLVADDLGISIEDLESELASMGVAIG
ncbi:MAG: hypothetical protein ACR2OE_01055 [Thermomicrobiales bacterium]